MNRPGLKIVVTQLRKTSASNIYSLSPASLLAVHYGQNRKEQVVLTRCRIRHSRLTHSYLLNDEERPECILCNFNCSLKYILIGCVDVADIRQTFYNTISDLFTNVAGDTILKF